MEHGDSVEVRQTLGPDTQTIKDAETVVVVNKSKATHHYMFHLVSRHRLLAEPGRYHVQCRWVMPDRPRMLHGAASVGCVAHHAIPRTIVSVHTSTKLSERKVTGRRGNGTRHTPCSM
jgi:hypothetical protein